MTRLRVFVLSVVVVTVGGCGGTTNLAFRSDDRLQFESPRDRQMVQLPLTLSWRIKGFLLRAPGSEPPTKRAGYFSIFIDRAPVKPGRSLRSVGEGDRACVHDPSCPDAQYLADRQVYAATKPSLKLTEVQPLETKDGVQLHRAIVVLMDTTGRRIGEPAWRLEFRVRKRTFG